MAISVPTESGINTSRPGDARMRQWIILSLFQAMECHLLGNKPLSKSMLDCFLIEMGEKICFKYKYNYNNFQTKLIRKYHPFCLGHNVSALEKAAQPIHTKTKYRLHCDSYIEAI